MSTTPTPDPAAGGGDAFFVAALALGLARSGLQLPACLSELNAVADRSLLHEARELLAERSHYPAAVLQRAEELLEAAILELEEP